MQIKTYCCISVTIKITNLNLITLALCSTMMSDTQVSNSLFPHDRLKKILVLQLLPSGQLELFLKLTHLLFFKEHFINYCGKQIPGPGNLSVFYPYNTTISQKYSFYLVPSLYVNPVFLNISWRSLVSSFAKTVQNSIINCLLFLHRNEQLW